MRLSYRHSGRVIPLEVIYRRRKTLEIRVEGPDRVVVIAPLGTPRHTIKAWVDSKTDWVRDKLQLAEQVREIVAIRGKEEGEGLLYLGSYYPIETEFDATATRPVITLLPDSILIRTIQPEIVLAGSDLEDWYRARAHDLVIERVMYYQPQIPIKPQRIRIKSQRRRWGSCSAKCNLNFNWKLALIPLDIIDYVVVHELCHLVHLNHSRHFWDLVASILPDYKERRAWLRRHPMPTMPFREE